MALTDALLASLSLDYAGPPVVAPGDTIRVAVVDGLTDVALVPAGPVPLEFSWTVQRVSGEERQELKEGLDYVAPVADGRVLNLVVAPSVLPAPSFGQDALPYDRIVIQAKVRVRLPAASPTARTLPPRAADGGWVALPELPLDLKPIALPTVLLSYVHTSFRPPVLVCVPFDSGLRSVSQLIDVVNELGQVASKLRGLAQFATWLAGLDTLAGALNDLPRSEVVLTARDHISDLNDFDMVKRGHPLANDTEAEDEFMALAFVAPPGTSATYYVDTEGGGGSLTLTTGTVPFVLVPSLVPDDPPVWPAGSVQFNPTTSEPEWENAFSSLKFGTRDTPVNW